MRYEVRAVADGTRHDIIVSSQDIAMTIFRSLVRTAKDNKVTECYYLENKEIKSYFLA